MAPVSIRNWLYALVRTIPHFWGVAFFLGWSASLGAIVTAPEHVWVLRGAGLYQVFALVVVVRGFFQYRRELQFLREFQHLSVTLDDLRQLDQDKPFQRPLAAVGRIAGFDRAILFLVDEEGEEATSPAAFNLPDEVRQTLRLRRSESPCIAWEVMDLNEPAVVDHPARNPAVHPQIKELFGDHPFAIAPIARGGVTWGCLFVDRHQSAAPITDDDLLQLQVMADQISITMQNHALHQELLMKAQLLEDQYRKVQRELALARIVQENVLPREAPDWKGLSMASVIRPARFIGGDFFRYVDGCRRGRHLCHERRCPGCPNHLPGVLIGDVCGKGIPAALVMAVVNSLFGEKIDRFSDPARILNEVNLSLKEYLGAESRFNSSAFLGFFHPQDRKFVYGNAGHDFPLHYAAATRETIPLEGTGTLLGIFRESTYGSGEIPLLPGDRLLFYTDGLLECLEANDEKADGFVILQEFLRDHLGDTAAACINTLQQKIDAGPREQSDDITAAILVAE